MQIPLLDNKMIKCKDTNVVWHKGYVKREERELKYGHKSGVVWFTGLSGSGKSTIAHNVEKILFEKDIKVYVLDGDNIRHGLNVDLGFSVEDRKENIRRIVEVAKLFVDAGIILLAAFISPYRYIRKYVHYQFKNDNFIEIFVKCSLKECERRDPKGHYKKARAGIIKGYTGIDTPFEEPEDSDLIIDTEKLNIHESVEKVIRYLQKERWIE